MSNPTTPGPAGDPAGDPGAPGVRRRLNVPVVLFLAALVAIALVVAFLAGRSGSGPGTADRPGTPGSGASDTAGVETAAVDPAPTCRPGPDQPAPTIDLGVQPSTGGARLISEGKVQRLVGLAKDAGAGVISTSTSWRFLQPRAATRPEDFRFRGIDRVVRAARQAGLGVRVQLIGIPRWAADDPASWTEYTPPTSPDELRRWTAFVTEVARHLDGRVDYLEVWNEPNGDTYWPGGPDAAGFARLLAATYAPVKAVAPGLQVVSGGLVANDVGYLDTLYQAVEDLSITPLPFDLLGVHPFAGAASPEDVDAARRYERPPFGLVDDNFTGFRSLRALMQERGDTTTDLYISAFGYGTKGNRGEAAVPDAQRAAYATEALEIVTCTPYVRAFSWYYLHPTPFDPVWWTLLDEDLQPTQTYQAFVAWAQAVAASGAPTS